MGFGMASTFVLISLIQGPILNNNKIRQANKDPPIIINVFDNIVAYEL